MEFIVALMFFVGGGLLLGARSRLSRVEYRLRLVEEELRRRIAAGTMTLAEPTRPATPAAPSVAPTPQTPHPQPVPPPEPVADEIVQPIAEVLPESEPASEPAPEPAPEPEPKPEPLPAAAWREPASRIAAPLEEPAPAPEPEPEPEPRPEPAPAIRRAAINFEELFGRQLPIWAGGITLAIAGILIVKYAIDQGIFGRIFTPGVQAVCGLLFGLGLIGGAEWAWRAREKVADPRVSQALSGAGISTLYAALLVAANLYHLISPLTAFFGLALVTGGALWLSLRHGMPSALLGLAGGLAAPALTVGLDANVPMLAGYLGFTIAGLAGVARVQRWPWLAMLALLGGAGWSLWLILAGKALETMGALSIGGFIALLALVLPLFVFTEAAQRFVRAIAAVIGAAQLGLLVAIGGFQPLHWGLFTLIAAAGQFLAWRERDFGIVPTLSAALSVLLLLIWPNPDHTWVLTFALALGAIHALPLLARLWHSPARLQRAVELSGIAIAAPVLALRHLPHHWGAPDPVAATSALGGALLLLVAAATGWKNAERRDDNRFALLLAVAGLLLSAAAWLGLAHWQAPLWTMGIAFALLGLAPRSEDPRIEPLSAAFAALALMQLVLTFVPYRLGELGALIGWSEAVTDTPSLLRWAGLALGFALIAWRAQSQSLRISACGLCAGLGYGAAAQVVPDWTLPIVIAAISAGLFTILQRREGALATTLVLPFGTASIALLGITGPHPLGEWLRLFDAGEAPVSVLALLRWGAVAGLSLLFAVRAQLGFMRGLGQIGAIGFAYGALAQVVPGWTLPIVMAGLVGLTLEILRRQDEPRGQGLLLAYAGGAIALLAITGTDPRGEWLRMIGEGDGAVSGVALARWGVVALLGAFYAIRARSAAVRLPGEAIAVLIGYGALAQVVPQIALPLVPPAALLAGAWWSRQRDWPVLRLAGMLLLALSAAWAFLPLLSWLDLATRSLAGFPMLLDRPELTALALARRLALPALLIAAAIWLQRGRLPRAAFVGVAGFAGALGLTALHGLYRHLFANLFGADFTATGLGQRIVWSALLLGAGWLAWKRWPLSKTAQTAASLLAAFAAFHTLWYSLLLHNPLWSAQHVGALPLLNLLAPLFAMLPLCLMLLARTRPDLGSVIAKVIQPLLMMLVAGFAWASLRQAFHATLLIEPGVSPIEDILRSILGIGLAIGFLLWGIRRKRHDWRIASLVLMLGAVIKVFLFDASGLEGLLRIASFVALGFSLIGIGWLYARQLRRSED